MREKTCDRCLWYQDGSCNREACDDFTPYLDDDEGLVAAEEYAYEVITDVNSYFCSVYKEIGDVLESFGI